MPVDVLRCRVCESEYPAVANGICVRCFGPLEPVYDWDALAPRRHARADRRPGRARCGATPTCCPPRRPRTRRTGPGLTPLVAAPRLARALGVGEVLLKLDLANPTHSFKDRVVAVAAAKAREFGLETLSATSTGNLANAVAARAAATGMRAVIFCPAGLEAEKLRGDDGLRRDGLRASAAATTTARASSASSRARSTGGSSTSTCAPTTPRARRRSRSRSAEQLGWETPDAVVMPIGSGAMFTKVWLGLRAVPSGSGLIDGRAAEALRRPGRGLRARGVGVRRGPARVAGAAELDGLVDRDRQPGRRRPRDRDGRDVGRRRSTRCPRTRSAPNISLLAETAASSARARPASRSARCARRSRAASSARATAWSCSSPAPA